METAQFVTLTGSIASIVLALVSIWLAKTAVDETRKNQKETSDLLAKIGERSAATESLVGGHFERMMATMLKIVESATTGPEVRKAELEAEVRKMNIQEHFLKKIGENLMTPDGLAAMGKLSEIKKSIDAMQSTKKPK